MTRSISRPELLKLSQKEMGDWLGRWQYDGFITLTLNDAGDGKASSAAAIAATMRRHLRDWDAHMNRQLVGRDWYKRPDNLMFSFFTPEKITSNPHWHGLVSFFGADPAEKARQGAVFDTEAEKLWTKFVPGGTVDVKPMISQRKYILYVVKSVCDPVNYDHFIVPDEFRNK